MLVCLHMDSDDQNGVESNVYYASESACEDSKRFFALVCIQPLQWAIRRTDNIRAYNKAVCESFHNESSVRIGPDYNRHYCGLAWP